MREEGAIICRYSPLEPGGLDGEATSKGMGNRFYTSLTQWTSNICLLMLIALYLQCCYGNISIGRSEPRKDFKIPYPISMERLRGAQLRCKPVSTLKIKFSMLCPHPSQVCLGFLKLSQTGLLGALSYNSEEDLLMLGPCGLNCQSPIWSSKPNTSCNRKPLLPTLIYIYILY